MNDIKWRFITFKLWRNFFFKLDRIEKVSDRHTKATYVYRFHKEKGKHE